MMIQEKSMTSMVMMMVILRGTESRTISPGIITMTISGSTTMTRRS